VRGDLKAVGGITNIETDLDELTCSFDVDSSVDVEELIDRLAEKNNKLSDWTFVEQ